MTVCTGMVVGHCGTLHLDDRSEVLASDSLFGAAAELASTVALTAVPEGKRPPVQVRGGAGVLHAAMLGRPGKGQSSATGYRPKNGCRPLTKLSLTD